jgi:hypothetical protein
MGVKNNQVKISINLLNYKRGKLPPQELFSDKYDYFLKWQRNKKVAQHPKESRLKEHNLKPHLGSFFLKMSHFAIMLAK